MTPVKFSNGVVLPKYLPVLRQLFRLCRDQCIAVQEKLEGDVPARIILAFLTKARDTLRAVVLLYRSDLCHESQSQIRILFELRVTFDAFIALLREDPKKACRRVLDAMLLEKLRQQRATEFRGLDLIPGAPTPGMWERKEREIIGRYGETEITALRRHGFSGISVEKRATQAGLQDLYNVVYRNFSRNVHSADFMELFLVDGAMLRGDSYMDLLESRNHVGCDVAFQSVFGIAVTVNSIYGLSMERRLRALTRAQKQTRKWGDAKG